MKNQHYQLAFSMIKGMTSTRAQLLMEQLDDINFLFNNATLALKQIPLARNQFLTKDALDTALRKAEVELKHVEKHGITPLFFMDEAYPFRLKECNGFPLVLYRYGNYNLNQGKILSIVGTRKSSLYGNEVCHTIIEDLANKVPDLLIVSGLAYGIDVAAHKSCVQLGVKTAGVLAHGMSFIYPNQHRSIAQQMVAAGGLLLSECAYEEGAEKHNFVKRNRIIAGIADATLLIESASKGGSMITAQLAHSYQRDVLAVPGRIGDKNSVGCNQLIKSNIASLVENADDVCHALNWDCEVQKPLQTQLFYEPSEQENEIIKHLLLNNEMSMNELCRATNVPIHRLSATLLNMEFNNLIKALPGNRYKHS